MSLKVAEMVALPGVVGLDRNMAGGGWGCVRVCEGKALSLMKT